MSVPYLLAFVALQSAGTLRVFAMQHMATVSANVLPLLWLTIGLTAPGYLSGAIIGAMAVRSADDFWRVAIVPAFGLLFMIIPVALNAPATLPSALPGLLAAAGMSLLYAFIGAVFAYAGISLRPRALAVAGLVLVGACVAYGAERGLHTLLPQRSLASGVRH